MKKSYVFILLILPVTLVLTAMILKYARGPYYICSDTEQDYIYLISSLAMAEAKPVLYTDHPGTTLQILGAATLKIAHALDFSEKDSLESAVLKNPEFYLTVINAVLISLNAILLFMIGLATYNLTKNIGLGLLLQFSPFFSSIPLRWGLNQVSCEPLLLFAGLLFMLILAKMAVSENISKSAHWYMMALAFVSGFGLATKVTFIPLLIIPLFALPKLRYKIGFLLLTGLSAVLWTWPITSQYGRVFQRLGLILTHTGWYGVGTAGIIDSTSLQHNLINILSGFLGDPFALLFFFFTVCIILGAHWSSAARKIAWQDTSFRILVAVLIVQLCTLLIIAKQSAERYALPALCLSGFLLFLIFIYLQRRNYFGRFDTKKVTFFIIVFLIFSSVWRAIDIKDLFRDYLQIKQESLSTYWKAANEYKNYLIISSYMTPSPVAALCYGNYMASHKYLNDIEMRRNIFSKGLYSESLQKIYGEAYFYNGLSGKFYTWTESFMIEDMIFKNHINKIIFHCSPFAIRKNNNLLQCGTGSVLHLRDVLNGVYDTIYILEGITIDKGNFQKFSLSPST